MSRKAIDKVYTIFKEGETFTISGVIERLKEHDYRLIPTKRGLIASMSKSSYFEIVEEETGDNGETLWRKT